MKNMIETFSALGARLLGFGDDDALQFTVMPGKPCGHFVQRRVMRIGDPAQRRRKGALLDSHGASQIDKRPSLHFQ